MLPPNTREPLAAFVRNTLIPLSTSSAPHHLPSQRRAVETYVSFINPVNYEILRGMTNETQKFTFEAEHGKPVHGHTDLDAEQLEALNAQMRDIADVPAIEIIGAAAVHLMSAAAIKCGLGAEQNAEDLKDLDEARKLITALAGFITAAAPEIGSQHAAPLRDGLRTLQLAFREASPIPDEPGQALEKSSLDRSAKSAQHVITPQPRTSSRCVTYISKRGAFHTSGCPAQVSLQQQVQSIKIIYRGI